MSTIIHHWRTGDLNGLNNFVGAQVAECKVAGSVDETGTVQWCNYHITVLYKKTTQLLFNNGSNHSASDQKVQKLKFHLEKIIYVQSIIRLVNSLNAPFNMKLKVKIVMEVRGNKS